MFKKIGIVAIMAICTSGALAGHTGDGVGYDLWSQVKSAFNDMLVRITDSDSAVGFTTDQACTGCHLDPVDN